MVHTQQRTARVEARIAQEEVCRTLENAEIIRLSVEDQRRFAEAILNPPEPVPALRRALAKHRELFDGGVLPASQFRAARHR